MVELNGTLFDGKYRTLDEAVARAAEGMVVEREAADCPYIPMREEDFGNTGKEGVVMAWQEVLLDAMPSVPGRVKDILADARLGSRFITITTVEEEMDPEDKEIFASMVDYPGC